MTGRETSVKRPTYALTCGFVCGERMAPGVLKAVSMTNEPNRSRSER